MMKATSLRLATALFVIAVAASAGAAENPIIWCGWQADPAHPLSWAAVRNEVQPLLANKNYRGAYQLILAKYRQAQEAVRERTPNAVSFEAELQDFMGGTTGRTSFQFIDRGPNESQLLLKAKTITFPCGPDTKLGLDGVYATFASKFPEQTNIGYAANLIFVASGDEVQNLLGPAADVIDNRATGYRGLLLDGLPMWPWELYLNGRLFGMHSLESPVPKYQVVFFRPSVGMEITWPSQEEAKAEASIGVEPIGFVRYTGSDYKNWWGASALVTLGTADHGAGLGVLGRYNNYAVGVTKRKNTDGVFMFFSYDFYDLVNNKEKRDKAADELLGGLRKNLEEGKKQLESK
jgi:hypothetical protein